MHPLQDDPHAGQPLLQSGARLEQARAALVLLHGRGSNAREIMTLTNELTAPGVAYLAPQAVGSTWYPNRFVAPISSNEPWLSGALAAVGRAVAAAGEGGVPPERTVVLGFSQGACLGLEWVARTPRRYGGAIGLSGALIEEGDQQRAYEGSLDGTPVFLGCDEEDFHIPAGRLERTARLLEELGADVTLRLYPGMGHTVNADELQFVNDLLTALVSG